MLTGLSIGMVSTQADLLAAIFAILPHKIAVLLLLSSMLLEIKPYSRFFHILLFSLALPTGTFILAQDTSCSFDGINFRFARFGPNCH